ncbi:MAG: Ig-like domain-containing protein [Clostridia bacterium]|nr:Ig-like domain-containing protein [Clostridia bacterium]
MKKVMVGILVIIPVIIVLVVALVSVFVSARTHIAVDDITLDKSYVEVELDASNSVYKLSDLFAVTIAPEKATNQNYVWSLEDLVCIDEDYKEMWDEGTAPAPAYLNNSTAETRKNKEDEDTCTQDGYLHINAYCSFVLKVQAETHVATCRVYVVGYKVESIVVVAEESMTVGDSALIQVETTPVDAKVDTLLYESSDPSILKVDSNGVVTAVGAGTATITAKASVHDSDSYVENSTEITVLAGATRYGNSVVTSTRDILFASLGVNASDVVLVSGATLNAQADGFAVSGDSAVIEVGGTTVNVTICDEGAIVIDNASIFEAQEDGGYVLATGGKPLALSASFADMFVAGAPEVTWSSNRETVAKVDANGVVTGVSNGRAVITATAGSMSFSVTINVREIVTVLLVETPDACAEEGIARETVNGSMVYLDVLSKVTDLTYYVPDPDDFDYTKKDNSFEFNFMRPALPEGADAEEFYSAFNFDVYEYVGEGDAKELVESNKAYFVGNRMYFNSAEIKSYTELVVKISAKYPKFASNPDYTTSTFVVKVTNGVAVSNWIEAMAVGQENLKEYKKNELNPAHKPKLLDMCLVDDIKRADGFLPDDELLEELGEINEKVLADKRLKKEEEELWEENGGLEGYNYLVDASAYVKSCEICVNAGLYGNGKMIYGYKSQYYGNWNNLIRISHGNAFISNVTLRACEVGDTIINDAEDTQGLVGSCISIETFNPADMSKRVVNNRIEFSIIENAGTTFRVYGGDYELDGCIVRNTSETAMFIQIASDETGVRYSHVVINNCVFSNMLGTAMSVACQGYCDGSEEELALVEQWIAEGKVATITQTGFWDIYNWQPTNVLNILPDEVGPVNSLIRSVLEESDLFKEKYSRQYNGVEYFHLGFLISGFKSISEIEEPHFVATFEDERIEFINTSELLPTAGKWGAALNAAIGGKPIYLFTYGQNGDLTPGSDYEVNNRLIRHLHGEI